MNGGIGGATLSAQDALFVKQTLPNSGNPPVTEIAIAVTNFGGACSVSTPGSSDSVLDIVVLGGDAKTYSVEESSADVSFLAQFDNSCHMHTWTTAHGGGETTNHAATFHVATGGTVTVKSVTSSQVEGTFDLTFDSGDHVTGSFSAGNCTPPSGGSSSC